MRRLLYIMPVLFLLGCSETAEKSPVQEKQPSGNTTLAQTENKVVAEQAVKASGKLLFAQRCSSCHGSLAEKKAMNVSNVIAGWEKAKILAAFEGYQNGTYGGKMKTIMKSQSSLLSQAQRESIADYLSTLK